jgi:uncharacterized protein (DUF1810 family)
MSVSEPFDLNRFVEAQEGVYAQVLAELRRGRKESHWIWFIFPQLRGLGVSAMSQTYGLAGLEEARAFAAHPVLGPRLRECVQAVLEHRGRSAEAVLGSVDALKFRSCLTLFSRAVPDETIFLQGLRQCFGAQADQRTLQRLGASP